MSRYFSAEITGNLRLNSNHNLLSLRNLDPMEDPLPGQFYMVEVNKGYDPLLKRAFSLFRRTDEGLQILYRIQGKGTAILGNLKEGAVIQVLGPLGNGYPDPAEGSAPVVLAGGIGIASVFPLIERLAGRPYVLYGARTRGDLFMLEELGGMAKELLVSTDDGSYGTKGNAVDLLRPLLRSGASLPAGPVVYACGPRIMLSETAKMTAGSGIRTYLSLEEHMACGIGACLGCVVKTKKGGTWEMGGTYLRVCKEGPVFNAEEIIW